jgi:hypothetical protein
MWLVAMLLVLVLVPGCINYEEEVTLKRDGSGEVAMHYWMDTSFIEAMTQFSSGDDESMPFSEEDVKERYEGKPGIELKSFRSEKKEGDTHAYITLAFDSVDALAAVGDDRTMTFAEEGGVITFTSTLESSGGGPEMTAPDMPTMTPAPTPSMEPDPEAAATHYQAGMSLKNEQKLPQAATEFRQAIANDPDHLDAHWALAWTHSALEQGDQAVSEFRQVLRLAPPDSPKATEAKQAIERLGGEATPAPAPEAPGMTGTAEMPEGMDEMGEAMAEGMGEAMGEMMGGMMDSGGDGGFTFRVRFPGEVLEVEGPGASKEKNVATWKLSFGDLMSAGMSGDSTMKATAKAGSPLPIVPILIGAVVVVVVLAAVTLLRRRK